MKIHFIAIGGAVMNNLAVSMVKKGFQVSGSDDEIFDPALSNLRKHGILPAEPGWFPEKITLGLDAVILGMHAKPGNPELDRALKLGLKVYSFPEYLYEQSRDKIRVVIAGSHGKTTITSMIMHVLRHQHIDFDYLVGAKTEGFDIMVRLTDAPVIVIEGDEYLTSALDPRPKFLHYKPHIALISGIAWDHINVFPTFSGYVEQFSLFIKSIEKNGHLVYCQNDPVLRQVVEESGRQDSSLPYAAVESVTENGKSWLIRQKPKFEKYPLKIFGNHNMLNISGAREVCRLLGIKEDDFNSAITTFKGASNRLERIADNGESAVFRDFAHAPSKLKATVESVKAQYPDRKLIAVMELHTYSSLSREFLSHYRNSMDQADIPVVFFSPHAIALKKLPSISPEDVIKGFDHPDLKVFTDTAKLEEFIRSCKIDKTNLLMMSSGNFGGIDLQKLCSEIF
ncbi:MAG TPA: Mur ligase family protein [Bacteroidales bacterium]|nr:Mur ligase family protein [Bacteroidales bacterium]HPR56801.1 Mur ligase family protein [Bacteroidales bacterium]HRW96013.1 Mur ligase family protein [Bacteroidales bacterium]